MHVLLQHASASSFFFATVKRGEKQQAWKADLLTNLLGSHVAYWHVTRLL